MFDYQFRYKPDQKLTMFYPWWISNRRYAKFEEIDLKICFIQAEVSKPRPRPKQISSL